jgi:hypothetical protein
MVSAIRGIQQSLSARSDISLAVKQEVTDLLPEFGAAWLEGANYVATLGTQKLFKKVRLSRFPYPVDSFERDEEA